MSPLADLPERFSSSRQIAETFDALVEEMARVEGEATRRIMGLERRIEQIAEHVSGVDDRVSDLEAGL